MSLDESFLEKLRQLPPDKQMEAISFVEFLLKKTSEKGSKRSLKGLWSNLGIDLSTEEISNARNEMWSKFPRESTQ